MNIGRLIFKTILKVTRFFHETPVVPDDYEKQEISDTFVDHRNPTKLTSNHEYGDVDSWALFYMVYPYVINKDNNKYFLFAAKTDMELFKHIWLRVGM